MTTVADIRKMLSFYPDDTPVTVTTPYGDVPVGILPIESDQGNYLVFIESPDGRDDFGIHKDRFDTYSVKVGQKLH